MFQKFKLHTGLLRAYEENGRKRLRTTASSTITDLAGDEIRPEALERAAAKAADNLTIFLNHEYRVPEDVFGSVETSSLHTRGVDSEGNPIVDMDFDIGLNESNPRAVQTYEAVKSGTRLGTSIGAIVKDFKKKKGGGLVITDMELLEASIVGIPANPRSWVQYAVKSLDEDVLADAEELDEETKAIEPDLTEAATCPKCGGAKGSPRDGCKAPFHNNDSDSDGDADRDRDADGKSIEPDKTAARTRVTVTVDSDAQDAPKSTPDAAPVTDEARADSPTDDATATLGDAVTRDAEPDLDKATVPDSSPDEPEDYSGLSTLAKGIGEMTTKVAILTKALGEERAKRSEAEENLRVAKDIIDRIADLPLGRKTLFKGAVSDFRTKFPQYDPEFLQFLEK